MNVPKSDFIMRLRDVLLWIPTLNEQELHKWEAAGLITTLRATPTSPRWYFTKQIAALEHLPIK